MEYRVEWWLDGSRRREYQQAYDLIAKQVQVKASDIVIDVGCGNGELLRRLGKGRLIGTDITPRMLRLAKMNLKVHAKESEIFRSFPSRGEIRKALAGNKIALVHDDYLQTKLPSAYANHVIMAFPDLEHTSYMNMISRELEISAAGSDVGWMETGELLGELREDIPDAEMRKIKGLVTAWYIRDTGIHRILARKGRYTLVDYASIDRPEKMLEQEMRSMEAGGLEDKFRVLDARFIEDDFIGSDAEIGKRYLDPSFKHHGYSISLLEKR